MARKEVDSDMNFWKSVKMKTCKYVADSMIVLIKYIVTVSLKENELLTWLTPTDWSSTTGKGACENTKHKIGNEATERTPCQWN